ncbi:hypothetical protein SESBI_31834 [Sesbania bispinosa]|nr:hypothetical protein SESBI_31834 [Sesbania bispinosa]
MHKTKSSDVLFFSLSALCENGGGIRRESPQKVGGEPKEDGGPQSAPAFSSPSQILFSQIQTLSGQTSNHPEELVVVRRSGRVANMPSPVYKEVIIDRVSIPRARSGYNKYRDYSNRVYASDEAREEALEKAEKLQSIWNLNIQPL